MINELPPGWVTCRVQEVFRSFGGGTPNKETQSYWGGNIPWLSSGDIKSGRIQLASETITKAGLENSSANLCRPGSVLVVVRSGILKHTLPIAVLEREAAVNQDIKCFDSGHDELNRWLALALRASAKDILAMNREGTTVQSVKYQTLNEFDLPVPPLAEQRRIVTKLETASGKVSACEDRLARIPVLLRRFRQSVLIAGCSGRLTADWRKEHEHEPWQQVTLNDVIEGRPKNGYSAKPVKYETPYRVLTLTATTSGKFDARHFKFFDEPIPKESSLWLQPDDILVQRGNTIEYVGVSAIYDGPANKFVYPDLMIRLRANHQVTTKFLYYALSWERTRKYLRERAAGTAGSMPKINQPTLVATPIDLPPVAEQQEIVRRVEAFFALADQIEARFTKARAHVDILGPALLGKAFRGELVVTEAELARRERRHYQPAGAFLDRVRRERSTREIAAIADRDRVRAR